MFRDTDVVGSVEQQRFVRADIPLRIFVDLCFRHVQRKACPGVFDKLAFKIAEGLAIDGPVAPDFYVKGGNILWYQAGTHIIYTPF